MGENKELQDESHLRFSFHEFLVDFLGSLVPGILFTAATCAVITAAGKALMAATQTPVGQPEIGRSIRGMMEASKDTPNMIWIGALVFTLILSYVLGHIFYRRDPKGPDRESFKRLEGQCPSDEELSKAYLHYLDGKELALTDADELKGTVLREQLRAELLRTEWRRRNLACVSSDECEFPYPNLANYLKERGHDHLLSLVRWESEPSWRTKTYINQLKIRLNYHHPDKYRRIIRNEAHVRLATSTWYLAKTLWVIGWMGVAFIAVGVLCIVFREEQMSFWAVASWAIAPLVAPISVLSVSVYSRVSCEKFIHYQRLREVYYVLELAYTAFRDEPEKLQSPVIKGGWTDQDVEALLSEESTFQVCLTKKTKRYHRPECPYVAQGSAAVPISFVPKDYGACRSCKPPAS